MKNLLKVFCLVAIVAQRPDQLDRERDDGGDTEVTRDGEVAVASLQLSESFSTMHSLV